MPLSCHDDLVLVFCFIFTGSRKPKHVLEGREGRNLCRENCTAVYSTSKKMAMTCLVTFNFTSMTYLATINFNCGPRF